jgi:hypothetical protein
MKVSQLRASQTGNEVAQVVGHVVGAEADRFHVETSDGLFHARRAASCLLDCILGDKVLMCIAADEAYILSVLEHDDAHSASITVRGDLDLHLPSGKINIRTKDGVSIASQQEISMLADRMSIGANRGDITISDLSFFGGRLGARLDSISLTARLVTSTVGSLYERLTRVFRKVEELEEVQAGRIELQAKDSLSLHGRHSMMTADQLVKVDGAQIHVG